MINDDKADKTVIEGEYLNTMESFSPSRYRKQSDSKKDCEKLNLCRQRLIKIEKEIFDMRENQIKEFKLKYECFKQGNTRHLVHYDLMHSALFGNRVMI